MTEMNVKKLSPEAKIPTYGSDEAAGMDLYALIPETDNPLTIKAGETKFIHTGLSMEIPGGFVGLIFARSGLGCKKGLAPANKVGVIDSDYRGEIMVALHNHNVPTEDNDGSAVIANGDRIAQMAIIPILRPVLVEATKLEDTDRGEGGFGSTGTK